MPTIDDILPLVGTRLNERALHELLGERGRRYSNEIEEGHPEDQRHYDEIAKYGVQMILGDGETIETIFFGKHAPYPWAFGSGLDRTSSREAVLAAMGTPERSGKPEPDESGCVGYDRFKVAHALAHFEYEVDCQSVRMITAMSPETAPHGQQTAAER